MARVKRLIAYVDGASRGNPGEASAAAVIQDGSGKVLKIASARLGIATNNVAEYTGAILALQEALAYGATELEIRTDSELFARQWSGQYKIKDPTLKLLAVFVRSLRTHFKSLTVVHVPRQQNTLADKEANRALDGDFLI